VPESHRRRDLIVLFLGALAIFLLLAGYCYREVHAPLNVAAGQTYMILPGSSLYGITNDLVDQGIVTTPKRLFRYFALLTRSEGTLKAGEYDVSVVSSTADLLDLLRSGVVIQRQITFLEGWTFVQWRQHLAGEPALKHVLAETSDFEVMAELGKPHTLPEGWFFPDTYRFMRGETDKDVLHRAHAKMSDIIDQEWSGRSVGDAIGDFYQALIVASIIEKETGSHADRGKISRVFVNRLQRDMRLQSDATVIYGLGDKFEGNLKRSHLKQPAPYNTYVNFGLPPTPIGMPGLASILAALHPDPGEFLFFVAKGDGTSYFSDNLVKHNAAVERYQRSGRRQDYQSNPQ
jgi:UPF0755 protein